MLMQGVRTAVHVLSVPLHLGFNGTSGHGPPPRPPARMRFLWDFYGGSHGVIGVYVKGSFFIRQSLGQWIN